MDNYDIMCFLEYYADRTNVRDPVTGKRAPTRQWQNFYQEEQTFSIDADVAGTYLYLAFDVDGFSSVDAGSINQLNVDIAAVGDIVDLTEQAVGGGSLVIATLIVQDAGEDSFDASSAQIINRYIGGIESASLNDTAVTWAVNPAIDKQRGQVPSRKITSDLMGRFVVQ
jgi:hypothetical protein